MTPPIEEIATQVEDLTQTIEALRAEISDLRAELHAKIPPGWYVSNFVSASEPGVLACHDTSGTWSVWRAGRITAVDTDTNLSRLIQRFDAGRSEKS